MSAKLWPLLLALAARALNYLLDTADEKDAEKYWTELLEGRGAKRAMQLIADARRVRAEAAGKSDPYLRP